MAKAAQFTLFDRDGNRLRARLLANGHILLSEHRHRYTYARVGRCGDVELYDDSGRYSLAALSADDGDEESEPAVLAA